MTFFSRAATTALAGLAILGFASSAFAGGSNHQNHVALSRAVMATGTNFYVNPAECSKTMALGWYNGRARHLVICQENAQGVFGTDKQVQWTEEDYDTLRHEAQHLIQDCMDGRLDSQLSSVYRDPIKFAQNTLSQESALRIIGRYRDAGADDHTIVLELEAFSVATINDPIEQVKDIRNYCGV